MIRRSALLAAFFCLFAAPARAAPPHVYTDAELLAMASRHSAADLRHLPLGDGKYTLDTPRKGYIDLCRLPRGRGGGAQHAGPWIHGSTWNPSEKIFVQGRQFWNDARFSMSLDNGQRDFTGNGLPVDTPTGIFPIQSSDPAFQYDRNPNGVEEQDYSDSFPLHPAYTDPPSCMEMEVGVMTNGVPLFNGFDADLRDAAAHEVQDHCDGHPQSGGEYHYHSLSACLKNTDIHHVIGYALDGFPITGGTVAPGKFLTTGDLDECHGLTSAIMLDGKKTVT
ncbi:MAG: YHYH protein, partial [Alphaproteobacteria bacterium]|nr:YHYH protein [Alphaproteobacteria bacterium]